VIRDIKDYLTFNLVFQIARTSRKVFGCTLFKDCLQVDRYVLCCSVLEIRACLVSFSEGAVL